MSKRLVRKCQCDTIMVVEVGESIGLVNVTSPNTSRSTTGYTDIQCIEGCCLAISIAGIIFNLPILNKHYFRAVYCNDCLSVRHLNKFEEFKV